MKTDKELWEDVIFEKLDQLVFSYESTNANYIAIQNCCDKKCGDLKEKLADIDENLAKEFKHCLEAKDQCASSKEAYLFVEGVKEGISFANHIARM